MSIPRFVIFYTQVSHTFLDFSSKYLRIQWHFQSSYFLFSTIELNLAIKVSNLYYDIGRVQCMILYSASPWEKLTQILMTDFSSHLEQCFQNASFQISWKSIQFLHQIKRVLYTMLSINLLNNYYWWETSILDHFWGTRATKWVDFPDNLINSISFYYTVKQEYHIFINKTIAFKQLKFHD